MKNMRRFFCALLPILLFAASCSRPQSHSRDTIPYVKAIAGDETSPQFLSLASFAKVPSSGDIYIIGGEESCQRLGEAFAGCDVFENARGRDWSDGLKDFAGETFSLMCDKAFTPYSDYAAEEGTEALREACVRLSLSALSDKCNVSIYDLEGNQAKTPAKTIILSDPWLLCCGKFDVDTLFSLTSCAVPVLSPQDLMLSSIFAGDKKYFTVGVLCDSSYVGRGVYPKIFDSKAREHGIVGAHLFESAVDKEAPSLLGDFLARYAESGASAPLEALLVDDWSISGGRLAEELAVIRDYTKEESMLYGKLISPDFVLLSSSDITMRTCYDLLRRTSLFTHRIIQPQLKQYTVVPHLRGVDAPFLTIPSENVQN